MDEGKKEIDWNLLKGSLIIFCVCLIVAGGLIGGSHYFNEKLYKEYQNNKNIFQSISQRYLGVDQEEKLLRDYYPSFVKLYNQGIIGREKRLNWIEALRQAGEKTQLPSLNYSISSQEEYIPEYTINYSGYTLYRSSMELNLGLLHEGDLFKLMEYLNRAADGIYTISECKFSMKSREIKFEKDIANISANCLLHWITIELSGGQEIKIG